MNHESPGGIKYSKRRRGILAKKRMHVNSMEAAPQDVSSGTNSAIKGGNAGCKPVCPGKDTLFACFNTDWRFYRELIAKSFGKSPSGNTELVKTWQTCPKNPTAVIPCGNEKNGECIDLRFNKCKVDILHGHCPGSHNVKCCPVGQVDKGETAPQPPSAMKNDIKPKDPVKAVEKVERIAR